MAGMIVWELYYMPNEKSYVFKNELVLIDEWYGNEKPTDQMIQNAINNSSYTGGNFIIDNHLVM